MRFESTFFYKNTQVDALEMGDTGVYPNQSVFGQVVKAYVWIFPYLSLRK